MSMKHRSVYCLYPSFYSTLTEGFQEAPKVFVFPRMEHIWWRDASRSVRVGIRSPTSKSSKWTSCPCTAMMDLTNSASPTRIRIIEWLLLPAPYYMLLDTGVSPDTAETVLSKWLKLKVDEITSKSSVSRTLLRKRAELSKHGSVRLTSAGNLRSFDCRKGSTLMCWRLRGTQSITTSYSSRRTRCLFQFQQSHTTTRTWRYKFGSRHCNPCPNPSSP
ncbi:hypothetical protein FB451DRAFT_1227108 [Mycena latifolia]|nr:hypothetical protein FB451DRAFT_1227108 [Mycena latifolia]